MITIINPRICSHFGFWKLFYPAKEVIILYIAPMKNCPETNALDAMHPLIREWFLTKVGLPTRPQRESWPTIAAAQSTLIAAPTGSGKTLSAFLCAINELFIEAAAHELPDETRIIYVSPLKALSNDVQKNLMEPLKQIAELALERGLALQNIKVGLRTGDTPAPMRRSMLKKPPHILVTTPESLYILLTAEKSRQSLSKVHTVVVDEIHALARDKRGVHLALSLERLEALAKRRLVRIGLSATQKPIELIAQFLTGAQRPLPAIVDVGHHSERKLFIEVPKVELSAIVSQELWNEIYDRLAVLAQSHRSILIFTNTRRLAERIAHNLSERLGPDQVAAHHGSLSMKLRLDVENKLKQGELKALVATASLELGIDIGKLDLVCQIGSPRSIAIAVQRVGRAGHWHGGTPQGHFFPTTRDELVECAALVQAIQAGSLDSLTMPKNSLDILAQQIVAMCVTDSWHEDELYALITRAFPYKSLSKQDFDTVIAILSSGISGARGNYGAYLFRDQVNKTLSSRKLSRLVAITNGGAIAENGLFTVVAEPHDVSVGTLDEDFAIESQRGEIILLGTTSWRIKRIDNKSGRVIVEDAHGLPPNVPFWRGEAPGRTDELSTEVASMRLKVAQLLKNLPNDTNFIDDETWRKTSENLQIECNLCELGAKQLLHYVGQGKAVLGDIPTQDTIIAERFFDEAGGMQLIIHSPFGARINKAWGLALRKKFCRSFNFELQAAATDNGINIALLEQHSFPLEEVFHFVHPKTAREVLTQAVLQSPLFPTRWRWAAMRSLALIKFRNGKKTPPNILRMLSDDLLASVFPQAAACQDNLPAGQDIEIPNHPLLQEAMKDVLNEALDVDGFCLLLEKIKSGTIKCIAVDTPMPSVFAHEILNANPYAFLDDAPLEERRARAVELRRLLPNDILSDLGKLDQEIIKEVSQQAWPDIRSKEELHDAIASLVMLPDHLLCDVVYLERHCEELLDAGRIAKVYILDRCFYIAAEKRLHVQALHPPITKPEGLADLPLSAITRDDALLHMVRQWLLCLGPTTSSYLAELLMINQSDIDQALLKLETTGLILRGHFTSDEKSLEWCERRILARIHRLTVEKLRKDLYPASLAQFVYWLCRWQHVAPSTRLKGHQGLLTIIKQLQGFELPANAWENDIFKARMLDYKPELLDHLGLKGLIGWGRLSPHPALASDSSKSIVARSSSSISFFSREDSLWEPTDDDLSESTALSSQAKRVYQILKERGASFFHDIQRASALLPYEVEEALWQLTIAGIVSADDFDNVRIMLNKKRKRAQGLRSSMSRWFLLGPVQHNADQDRLEKMAWLLLNRYGVVFRELLHREKNMPSWRDLLGVFRRLEDQGQIRGGRFISGLVGEQFALAIVVESLRQSAQRPLDDQPQNFFAVDPLNLSGTILAGPRIKAITNKRMTLHQGNLRADSV